MKKKIYEILRSFIARKAAHYLGKIEILDDEIICYVDERKIKKQEKYLHRYNIIFHSIPYEEVYKIYRVDKPVHYIIKNVEFDREVNIISSVIDCHVTFENCTFTAGIQISKADHITFKNNKYRAQSYKNYRSIYKEGEFCISTFADKNKINKIEILNDNIQVENINIIPMVKASDISKPLIPKEKKPTVEMWLYGKEITFINANIIDAKSIEIGSDNLKLWNSNICVEEVEIASQNIDFEKCKIKSDVISINADYIMGMIKLNHNGLFINGVEVNKTEKEINQIDLKLQKQRLKLINTLKKIESSCEKTIADEVRKKTLIRVLKK